MEWYLKISFLEISLRYDKVNVTRENLYKIIKRFNRNIKNEISAKYRLL